MGLERGCASVRPSLSVSIQSVGEKKPEPKEASREDWDGAPRSLGLASSWYCLPLLFTAVRFISQQVSPDPRFSCCLDWTELALDCGGHCLQCHLLVSYMYSHPQPQDPCFPTSGMGGGSQSVKAPLCVALGCFLPLFTLWGEVGPGPMLSPGEGVTDDTPAEVWPLA